MCCSHPSQHRSGSGAAPAIAGQPLRARRRDLSVPVLHFETEESLAVTALVLYLDQNARTVADPDQEISLRGPPDAHSAPRSDVGQAAGCGSGGLALAAVAATRGADERCIVVGLVDPQLL